METAALFDGDSRFVCMKRQHIAAGRERFLSSSDRRAMEDHMDTIRVRYIVDDVDAAVGFYPTQLDFEL